MPHKNKRPGRFRQFFPDFVCELEDGRILVVEYKGEHLRNVPMEIEKDQVGRLWAEKSTGKCLFLMAFAKDNQGRDVRGQLDAMVGSPGAQPVQLLSGWTNLLAI